MYLNQLITILTKECTIHPLISLTVHVCLICWHVRTIRMIWMNYLCIVKGLKMVFQVIYVYAYMYIYKNDSTLRSNMIQDE